MLTFRQYQQEQPILSQLLNLDMVQQAQLDMKLHNDAIAKQTFGVQNQRLASDKMWKQKFIDIILGKEIDPNIIRQTINNIENDLESHRSRSPDQKTGSNAWHRAWIAVYEGWLKKLQLLQKEEINAQDTSAINVSKKAFHVEFKNAAQKMAWAAFGQHDVLFLLGPAGVGKALTLDSKLYTKTGYIRMGDAKMGDEIANSDGNYSKIIGVYPQGKKSVCRVHFSNYTYVDCCEDHLWKVTHCDNGWTRVVDTKYLELNCRRKDGKRWLSIECCKPVNFESKDYLISPYMMGIILAEGNTTGSNLCFSSVEKEVVARVAGDLDNNYVCRSSNGCDYRVVKYKRSCKPNRYKDYLKEIEVWGKFSYEKSIPEIYKFGSVHQRIALLQGLMDGDGTVDKRGLISYSTTSYKLAKDFCQIIYSLGGTTRIKSKSGSLKKDGSRHRVSYRCQVNLPNDIAIFFLSKKRKLQKSRTKYFPKLYIDRIERLPEQEMQCITVDHPKHLYLTDNFTVTHNTFMSAAFAIGEILNKTKDRIILTRPIVEAGESLGFLPGDFVAKTDVYFRPLYDCIGKLVGFDGPQRERIDRSIEVAPIAYMRGRAQPLDAKILTPIGYKLMEELVVGDEVIGSNGQATIITGVYPQGVKKIYRVTLSDGSFIECCEDHLWLTQSLSEKRHNKPFSVKTTKEIRNNCKTMFNQKNHKLPLVKVNFPNIDTSLDPYLLGLLLGDGHIRKGAVKFTTTDAELLNEIKHRMPCNMIIKPANKIYDFNLVRSSGRTNPLLNLLGEYNLVGKKSYNKFIPDAYKFNSDNVRLEILRGLLDTDGWIGPHKSGGNCRIQYYSYSEQLADDVRFIVQSLGGVAYKREREFGEEDFHWHKCHLIRHCRSCFVLEIVFPYANPFRLARKAIRYTKSVKPIRLIASVEPVGEKECQCIKVAADDGLYVADHCIITHNTFDNSICIFDEAQNASFMQLKLFLTRFGEDSKIIITGDPTQSDLKGPVALVDVVERLKTESGIGVIEFNNTNIVRHPLVGRILEKLA